MVEVSLAIDGVRYECQPVTEEQGAPAAPSAPWEDVRARMPRNQLPDNCKLIASRGGWWQRELSAIDGIAIHHTMTNNLEATAAWITKPKSAGGKGHATSQYHFWVAADGRALYCVDLREGLWHDHAGDENTHISIGMAGRLDFAPPPDVQLQAAVRLVWYLMREFMIPRENVAGHNDWAWSVSRVKTVCPGWDKAGWRSAFFAALGEM